MAEVGLDPGQRQIDGKREARILLRDLLPDVGAGREAERLRDVPFEDLVHHVEVRDDLVRVLTREVERPQVAPPCSEVDREIRRDSVEDVLLDEEHQVDEVRRQPEDRAAVLAVAEPEVVGEERAVSGYLGEEGLRVFGGLRHRRAVRLAHLLHRNRLDGGIG